MKIPETLPHHLAKWAAQFEAAALCYGVDPMVLAAIVDRESLGGDALTPQGPSGFGDHGHGRGLCQIDDRYHKSFIDATGPDGVSLWKDPAFNILYAAKLLRMNLDAFGGDYVAAIAAYNAGIRSVRRALLAMLPDGERLKAVDSVTTGQNYARHVLSKRDGFANHAAEKEAV